MSTKKFFLRLIRLYQKRISFVFRVFNPVNGCRFYPSCSQYSYYAIEKHGVFVGLLKSFKRIIKCNPFNKGGYDPC